MNILIFSSNSHYFGKPVGGAETSLRLIAEKFAELNENVYYATMAQSRLPGIKKCLINGVKVYALCPFRWPYFNGKLFAKSREKFIQAQLRWFLARTIRTEMIDVVHTYNDYPDTYNVLTIRKQYQLNIIVVQRIAGLFWAYQIKNKMVSPEKIEWVFNNVDLVNYILPGLKELFYLNTRKYSLNVSPKREIVMDIGVNLCRFHCEWKPHKQRAFKIICVARLADLAKRQDILIEALGIIRNKNIRVEFVGSGPKLESYRKRARELEVEDRIKFHGFVPQREIPEILMEADLFALPTDYEALCKAILEAMAIGLPCLVSDVSTLNSYIREGFNGYLCLNSPERWAKKIEIIYDKRHELYDLSNRAREFIINNYNASKNILKYKEEFERVKNCSA